MAETEWARNVVKARQGDMAAFGELVRRFQKMAVGYAYSVLLDFDLAEDAAQEAFLQAYIDLGKLQEPVAFPGWFRRIVFSRCTRCLRGRPPTTVPLESLAHLLQDSADSPHAAAERRELHEAIRAAIGTLTEAERSAVTLFYIGGYSHREVGTFLDVPAATVKSRLHTARHKLRERMIGIMERTLRENAPGEAFHRRVADRVERLVWGVSGECTFAGALAAATRVTPFPYDYQSILGVTGLAFRTRWFQGPEGERRWCPSSPVGEFPDEVKAARRATGWALRPEDWTGKAPVERLAPDIVRSIDAGLPVLGYDDHLNMAVICGYEDEGRTVLMREYPMHGDGDTLTYRPTADLQMFVLFLEEHRNGLSPRDAAYGGIAMGIRNWSRRHDPDESEVRGYWLGKMALERWAEDIGRADTLTEEERNLLFFVSWWTFDNLADVRRHAGPFLRQAAPLFLQSDRPALERAAALYDREADLLARTFVHKDVFLGHWTGKSINDWTEEVRRREQELLAGASRIESEAIAALQEIAAPQA